jgi:ribonuclease Y
LVIGILAGYFYRRNIAEAKVAKAEDSVKRLIEDAQKRAEAIKKETVLEAKEEVLRLRNEFERETKERRNELQRTEKRLSQREELLDKKLDNIETKEEQLNKKQKELHKQKEDMDLLHKQEILELEKISGLSRDDAKELLMEKVEQEARRDVAILVRDIEARAKDEADKKAKNIIANDTKMRSRPCG